MEVSVEGLRVLITAAGSGIGRVMARTFTEEGAAVHISDIETGLIASAREEMPNVGTTLADAADPNSADRLVAEAVQAMGGIDCLINNVGIKGPTGSVDAIDPDAWSQSIDINLKGHFYVAHAAVPHIKAAGGGSIITMSSVAGRLGFPGRTPYAAAKWGLVGFTQSMAMELGVHNIRANAIMPGNVKGERMERVLEAEAESEGITVDEARARAVNTVSMRTWIDPEEIADLAVFLASKAGHHISGQSISICGNLETLGGSVGNG